MAEIVTLSAKAFGEIIDEIKRLREKVDSMTGDHIPPNSPDAPFPAIANEDIAADAMGAIRRQVNTGDLAAPTYGDSTSIPTEQAFNIGPAIKSGDKLTAYRDPSSGALLTVQGRSKDDCLCVAFEMLSRQDVRITALENP